MPRRPHLRFCACLVASVVHLVAHRMTAAADAVPDSKDGPVAAKNGASENWPGFRGPTGCGLSQATELPLAWGGPDRENVLWSTDLPGDGISSPIVWNDRVFALTASRKEDDKAAGRETTEQYVSGFDAKSGALLWNTVVPLGPWARNHTNRWGGGFANATPATDGERVYALFGSSVLVALDFDGRLVWRQELVPFRYDMEMATSPVLFGETVIVYCGMKGGSRLVAFDRKSGEVAWDKDLADTGYGHNTPLLLTVADEPRMVLMGAGLGPAKNAIQGFDPRTGERLWWCAGKGETASPVLVGRDVYCDCGRGGPAKLVDPSGRGDVTETHVKWETNVASGLGSPLVVGGHIYRLHDSGTFSCWNAETGERVYQARVADLTSYWASPVADAAGRIYLATAGTSLVVAPGPEYEVHALNKLGDRNHASPAVAGNRLYFAGAKQLHAIGRK